MRILFLTHRLPYPPNKGDKIRSFWMLQNLTSLGDVDLFCFYDDIRDAQYIPELKRMCNRVYAERISPLLARIRAAHALFTGTPFSLGYFDSPVMRRCVAEAINQRHYDLIFIFCTSMAQYLPPTQIPAVLDMVDVDSDKWAQYAEQRGGPACPAWKLEAKRLSKFEQQVSRQFHSVLLCTEREVKLLIGSKRESNVLCAANRFDLEYFNPESVQVPKEIDSLRPFVVFTGQMDYFPNVDAVQRFRREIFPHLVQVRPELKFVVVGRNPNREVRRLQDHSSVVVTGEVADVRPYLKAAEVAVLPLRIARGIQNKALEALAMGVPVVASGRVCEALPESVARFVRKAESPHDFATATFAAMSNEQSFLEDVRRELASQYGSEGLRRQLVNLILSFVGSDTSMGSQTDFAAARGKA